MSVFGYESPKEDILQELERVYNREYFDREDVDKGISEKEFILDVFEVLEWMFRER